MTPEDLQQTEQQELFQPFLLWWMAVLLFGAKPVTGSTSRKWDMTSLALLPRLNSLASLSPRWDSCQIQSITSEQGLSSSYYACGIVCPCDSPGGTVCPRCPPGWTILPYCPPGSIYAARSWRGVCRHTAWRSFLERNYRGEQSYGVPWVVWDCFYITIFLSSLDMCVQRSSKITSIRFWTTMLH